MHDTNASGHRDGPLRIDATHRAVFRAPSRRRSESDGASRLLLDSATHGSTRLRSRPAPVDQTELDRFFRLVRGPNQRGFDDYLSNRLASGDSLLSVSQDLIAPVAHRLGRLWEDDRCNFVEVTVASARLQRALRAIGSRLDEAKRRAQGGRVLVCGLPGDQHTLGPVMVAETLAREGLAVTLGPPFTSGIPLQSFDLVAFSVAKDDAGSLLKRSILKVRRRSSGVPIIVGGDGITRNPDMGAASGADGWASDLEGLLDLVRAPFRS